MASIDLTLTPKQASSLRRRLKHDHSESGRELLALVETAMGGKPLGARCRHCSFVATSEQDMLAHLLVVENYPDDEYGEDTAQSNAYRWWADR